MSRIRTLKPDIWTSADFLSLDCHGQLCFIWLISNADDAGRLKTDAAHIARVLHLDVVDALSVMEARGMVRSYVVDGHAYVEVRNFTAHQRIDKPSPSKYPPPPNTKRSKKTPGVFAEDSENVPRTFDSDPAPRARPRIGSVEDQEGKGSISLPNGTSPRLAPGVVDEVWTAYLSATGLRRELTPPRRDLIARRLKVYPAPTLVAAMHGHIHDPWEGREQQREPEHLLKPTNIERFATWELQPESRPRTRPDNAVDRQVLALMTSSEEYGGPGLESD